MQETENLDLPLDRIQPGVENVLNQRHLGAYYVIIQDGQVIAQLMITYEWSDWRNASVWWIQSVYVRPPYRRQGCFRHLYQHVRQAAAAAGAGGLRLYADDNNISAHATVSPSRCLGCGAGSRFSQHGRCWNDRVAVCQQSIRPWTRQRLP